MSMRRTTSRADDRVRTESGDSRETGDGAVVHSSAALIVANGDCDTAALARHHATSTAIEPLVIAVDGGLAHLRAASLPVDIFVGDADSTATERLTALDLPDDRCWILPRDKDASDLEHALERVATLDVAEVDVFGISGGRSDHMLLNWQLPVRREWPFRLTLHDATIVAVTVRRGQPLERRVAVGTTFSVIALESASGLSIHGARWSLDQVEIEPGQTLGLSNRVVEPVLRVSLVTGVVLVCIVIAPV